MSKAFIIAIISANLIVVIIMDIFYTKETLFVNMNNNISNNNITTMQKRVFKIIEDYDIDNIVLNLGTDVKSKDVVSGFVDDYHKNHNGNLKIN